jgi:aryl-alcohol dehydrogenase-like predicted oxidoreductase
MSRKPWIVPIPGTRRQDHLIENLGALELELTASDLQELETSFATMTVNGLRMDEENMRAIDGWPVSTI